MSLWLRLIASTLLGLLLGLALSAGLAVLRAREAVRTELGSAMAAGQQFVRNGLVDLSQSPPLEIDTAGLVATFAGNRHLQVLVLSPIGGLVARSRPARDDPPVPNWFLWLVRPRIPAQRTPIPPALGGGAILLQPEPANEVGEVWQALGNEAIELAVFCLTTSLLVFWVTERALRPLGRLSAAFGRIGAGDYAARVPTQGPTEIVALADSFNRMAEHLARVSTQNRRLHEQLLVLQEEERADLARDLHDEIGPFLFSVNVTAAAIDQLAANGRAADIPAEVAAIREAVAHMQKHVRALLAQLRPPRAVEYGLVAAIASLVAFWRNRHPGTTFSVVLDEGLERMAEATQEVVYRVVQESLSNAVRHAAPQRISVAVHCSGTQLEVRIGNDGVAAAAASGGGFGLTGMRERVTGMGGVLYAGPNRANSGDWEVYARLQLAEPAAAQVLARVP